MRISVYFWHFWGFVHKISGACVNCACAAPGRLFRPASGPQKDARNRCTSGMPAMTASDTSPSLDELTDFAAMLADIAAPLTMAHFRTPLDVEQKADLSPVTRADREVESAMRAGIAARFPDHGILGEEHGDERAGGPHLWVIDPIDGTRSFITGMPTFGTLIAHLDRGRPDVGVIAIPATGERWQGARGRASLFQGLPCRTSGCTALEQARLYTTSPDLFDAAGRRAFDRVSARTAMRRFGGDCYAYGLLASGHVDLVVEMNLQPYDYMALVCVIEGAGGVITDWQGRALTLASSGHVVAAATGELHAQALAALTGG